jgi:UDP-glucose 4-epimerase
MHVLVIGGAGYIGSHVVLSLRESGHDVTVYDNLSSGTRANLLDGVPFVEADLLDSAALQRAMTSSIDAVIHLAAFKAAGESMLHPEKYSWNNIAGTIGILNAMCDADVRFFVFSSSAAVYGEPEYLPVDEGHPTEPENYYGFTKLEIERILRWYDKLKSLRFAALRYFNAAGYDPGGRIRGLERNPANLLPVIMEVAAGSRERLRVFGDDFDTRDGTGVRDYVHVSDLAIAHVQALDYVGGKDASLTVNLGSETGLSVMEILEAARRICGKEIPAEITDRRPGDPARLVASSGKARELLGWQPKHSDLDSLVESSWSVYKAAD